MRPLLSLQFSWKYLCRTFILCVVTKWQHFLRQIKKQLLSYLGKSGVYWVTFQVPVEIHVGIHAKRSLLLPNLTKSGICGYVFSKILYQISWKYAQLYLSYLHLYEQQTWSSHVHFCVWSRDGCDVKYLLNISFLNTSVQYFLEFICRLRYRFPYVGGTIVWLVGFLNPDWKSVVHLPEQFGPLKLKVCEICKSVTCKFLSWNFFNL